MNEIHKNLMILSTASSSGKSITVTALCRIFAQDGIKVAPFKAQNMSLNSYVTDEGLEIGRSQAVQAEACGILPKAAMNPILLKPSSDRKTQIIIEGKVFENLNITEYSNKKEFLTGIIKKNYERLKNQYEVIVLEGAGSPVEINIKDNDIVNMSMAEMVDAPVILVADIDRGGVFASILGTILLLNERERQRVKGIIINKFRGDVELLKPGIKKIEEISGVPVLGVIPYFDIKIEDEDSATEKLKTDKTNSDIDIAVIKLPYISNFTDMDVLSLFNNVNVRYVKDYNEIGEPDILIIPGSKNTIEDILFLKHRNIDKKILQLHKKGKLIVGICAGFQMLGTYINDPYNIESDIKNTDGLGLLDIETTMLKTKTTNQICCKITNSTGILSGMDGVKIKGYEIHMGETKGNDDKNYFIKTDCRILGIVKNNIIGTYIHGIFDNTIFSKNLINNIRIKKNLKPDNSELSYNDFKNKEYDKLAEIFRNNLDMDKIYAILNKEDYKHA
jgi:adenosylcobyric acid synthase